MLIMVMLCLLYTRLARKVNSRFYYLKLSVTLRFVVRNSGRVYPKDIDVKTVLNDGFPIRHMTRYMIIVFGP